MEDRIKKRRAAYSKAYSQKNRERLNELTRMRYHADDNKKAEMKSRRKEWRINNSVRAQQYAKEYRQNNKENYGEYIKTRLVDDELFKAIYSLRIATCIAFKRIGQNKPTNTETLLGCSWVEAKEHFEKLFEEGMSWANHGEWHIDHIKPVNTFQGLEDISEMNHISNLRPLWAEDNIRRPKDGSDL